MKNLILLFAAVVLVGCGTTKVDPDTPANITDPIVEEAKSLSLMPNEVVFKARAVGEEVAGRLKKPIRDSLGIDLPLLKFTLAELLKVTHFSFNSNGLITDADLVDFAKLQNLEWLSAHNTQITDEGLKEVAKLQNLRYLGLRGTKITDEGLKEVAKLQQLTSLTLSENKKITDEGLKEVAKLQNLKTLFINHTNITDEGLRELYKLQKLEALWLGNTEVTRRGAAELRRALPNCETLGVVKP